MKNKSCALYDYVRASDEAMISLWQIEGSYLVMRVVLSSSLPGRLWRDLFHTNKTIAWLLFHCV